MHISIFHFFEDSLFGELYYIFKTTAFYHILIAKEFLQKIMAQDLEAISPYLIATE